MVLIAYYYAICVAPYYIYKFANPELLCTSSMSYHSENCKRILFTLIANTCHLTNLELIGGIIDDFTERYNNI